MTLNPLILHKMRAELSEPVAYYLGCADQEIHLNSLLGRIISLQHTGKIHCIHCDRQTSKSFNQGYCYPCFKKLAQCDSCIMSPEKCHYFAGTCREPQWADEFCMQDHFVYLANSSGLKVGITRSNQIPTRWIDQGAIQAVPVLRVKTRQQSGFAEMIFKQRVADKTNWRTMLQSGNSIMDIQAARTELLVQCADDLQELQQRFGLQAITILDAPEDTTIQYPILQYPQKVNSLSFDKTPLIEGVLLGIKGQYLILDCGVLNIRKFTAYQIAVTIH